MPTSTPWSCWRDGCLIEESPDDHSFFGQWQTAGMQTLVNAVRATGARQPIMLGGLDYAQDLGAQAVANNAQASWLEHMPSDPLSQIVASVHSYCDPQGPGQLTTLQALEDQCKAGLEFRRDYYQWPPIASVAQSVPGILSGDVAMLFRRKSHV